MKFFNIKFKITEYSGTKPHFIWRLVSEPFLKFINKNLIWEIYEYKHS